MDVRIEGGRALVDGQLVETSVEVTTAQGGMIAGVGGGRGSCRRFDASGLLVLPGIVDIHGDAFERQMMPRPGVGFPLDIALLESDRQAVANGITTLFHGVTWSWEPGLRGTENARALFDTVERLRPQLAADTRLHLRHETYNLDAEAEITDWLQRRRIDVLAFNDHMTLTVKSMSRPEKLARMVEQAGLDRADFDRLIERVLRRENEIPASIERLAGAAQRAGVALLSHDDTSPGQRRWFRSLGCRVAEFPTTAETAADAAANDDFIVFGAPNVVRGSSHTGWVSATDMIARDLCSVLASDYYYPAPLLAAFQLATKGVIEFARAWSLISGNAAEAAGLSDRGRIAAGSRADLVLVDASDPLRPRTVGTVVGGSLVYLTAASRLCV